MINVNIDFGKLATGDMMKSLSPGEQLYDTTLRTVANTMLGVVKNRIHEEGKDANGSQIGNYTKPYMVVRTNSFKNNLKTKGKEKGQGRTTSAGEFTKGKNKGQPRPIYNRTNDTKVVISLTRQMENDFVVIPTQEGYGLGYNNPDNRLKVDYVEHTYGKKIFSLTTEEKDLAIATAQKTIHDAIS